MDDIEKYSRMNFIEFIEFIARAGALLYSNESEWLFTQKVEKVLEEILKCVSEKVRHPPKTEDDELVSDFEEDIIQLAKKKIKEAQHEQFLIVDITKKE